MFADKWEAGFNHLSRFVEREGHSRVLLGHMEDVYPLGRWVGAQRSRYSKGQLLPDRIVRLDAISGWTWDVLSTKWEERLQGPPLLRRSRRPRPRAQRLGRGRLPTRAWVSRQRSQYQSGKLDPGRALGLEELRGWSWNVLTDKWEEGFKHLSGFIERESYSVCGRATSRPATGSANG